MKNEKKYTTSQVAKIIGIHPNTVRKYEKWGMIPPPKRKANGYRVFTDYHILQMQLIRVAFQIPVVYGGVRRQAVLVVKTAAKCQLDQALLETDQYLFMLQREQRNAKDAIGIAGRMSQERDKNFRLTRQETADYLDTTIDTLRNWERNGLLAVKRSENGYRFYDDDDIRQLKMIKALRAANYSLTSILRLMHAQHQNPGVNIKESLNTPEEREELISVYDKLLDSLGAAISNAKEMKQIIRKMKKCNPPL